MSIDDPNKLEQAIEQLEAERARRVEAKIEAGQAVRGTPIVVGGIESIADWKQPTHDSEGREIVFGPDDVKYIITGVPRADRDPEYCARLQRETERGEYDAPNKPLPHQPATETKAAPPLPKPAPEPERPPNPQRIRTQVKDPDPERGDPGQVIEGFFDVRDGMLHVWNDTDASPIGTTELKPGDDPAAAARKLLREKSGKHSSFYEPIRYNRVFH